MKSGKNASQNYLKSGKNASQNYLKSGKKYGIIYLKSGGDAMYHRKIEEKIKEYFQNDEANILVIDGARQIGKSYIIRYMCENNYANYIEINLKDDFDDKKLFESIKSTDSFYLQLSALYGNKLNDKSDTIVFLDEIQCYPHLLSLLKPLKKDGKFKYIISGSLLGITLKHTFIPMGSIDECSMYPMDFEEFLWANNVGKNVIDYLKEAYDNLKPIDENIHKTILDLFKKYILSGGLPDAVKELVDNTNISKMRNVHEKTYNYYKDDASQYDLEHKLKIANIYSLMVSFMENKVKRLTISSLEDKKDVKFERYNDEYDYLLSSGIALGVNAISEPKFPLKLSMKKNLIKLYYNDIGLLSNLLFRDNINSILNNDKGINLGSLYETCVCQELKAHGHELFYFDRRKEGEVDFLIDDYKNETILPIEIKSGKDQSNYRAIPKLVNNKEYKIKKGYIFGNQNIMKEENNLITMPIYLIMFV